MSINWFLLFEPLRGVQKYILVQWNQGFVCKPTVSINHVSVGKMFFDEKTWNRRNGVDRGEKKSSWNEDETFLFCCGFKRSLKCRCNKEVLLCFTFAAKNVQRRCWEFKFKMPGWMLAFCDASGMIASYVPVFKWDIAWIAKIAQYMQNILILIKRSNV